MSNNTLSISRLIKVSVSLAASAAQSQNINSLLILGTSTVIDTVERIRSYASIEEVAADFGTGVEEYLQAFLWFEQAPQPTTLSIGRWANTASAGQLLGAPLTTAQQALANFTAITTGSMTITVDGDAQNLTAVNLSAVLNLNGVATAINGKLTGAVCVWEANQDRFVITSSTTGAASSVSFATVEGTGVDISALLGLQQANSGSYVAPGLVAETALQAVTLFDNNYGQQWFGLCIPSAADSDNEAVGPYIEASANFHYFGWSTVENAVIAEGDTDIASEMKALTLNRSGGQYSSTNPYSVASLLARILTTDYTANNSTITLMYKQEPGIVAENLSSNQLDTLESKNCNVFVAYDNNTAIIEPGVSSSGAYIDSVIGAMVFGITLQTALFNALYTTTTKIPQTDAGMSLLAAVIEQVATQFVNNGLFAPGTWTNAGFGSLTQGAFMSKGYYLYTPPISSQNAATRATRVSVPFQLAAKLAGAVQTVDLQVTVNS